MKIKSFSKFDIKINYDSRGWFKESYNEKIYQNILGNFKVKQSNITLSKKAYTVRGFHYQKSKNAQNKILQLLSGSIDDYVLCMNKRSKYYLKLFKLELKKLNEIIVIPKEYAHCVVTKKDNTILNYYVDNFYNYENEVTLNPINIFKKHSIKLEKKIYVSKKDRNGVILYNE
tara:strand:+ start:58 stop:576 length:519 start_codon:yes stop_codon:yes gene_type:complete